MKIVGLGFLVLTCLAGSAQTADRSDEQQIRILSLENAWNQAVAQKDVRAINALMAEELIYVEYDGKVMNKAEYLASMRSSDSQASLIVSDSMHIQMYGPNAVVVGMYQEKGTKSGKPYSYRERFIDAWINRNGMWVCVASQSTMMSH
ncbi:MAG TPA: nuclear transport factor 2 family protein [Candidatus Sulfotelmatobacter sp.]